METKKKFSSEEKFDMVKEYVYHNYRYIRKENSAVYGIESADEVCVTPVYFDELCYILMSEGAHLVLFGGPWSEKTQNVIDAVNFYASKYHAHVYSYDFRSDSMSRDTDIKVDISYQASYDGPDKKEPVGCAESNYIYGNLVSRHLRNLEDWVGNKDSITYLSVEGDAVTVPDLREPFLMLFDKDNQKDNSGRGQNGDCPIVAAVELDFDHGDKKIGEVLEQSVFRHIESIAPWSHQDYMYEAYRRNQRGHAFKTEDAFKKEEKINIVPVSLPVFLWILQQEGTFAVLFGGAWCANTQACIATLNDYAVANGIKIYMLDARLDGKHPIDFWKYARVNELKIGLGALKKHYIEIWEKYLPGAPILCSMHSGAGAKKRKVTVDYTDEAGEVHSVLGVDMPYLAAVNKERVDQRGNTAPVLAACNHGGVELINCLQTFIYAKHNYRKYTSSVYNVFYYLMKDLGKEVQEITIDRTAPIVEGEPVRHEETVYHTKEHDWYALRGKKMDE